MNATQDAVDQAMGDRPTQRDEQLADSHVQDVVHDSDRLVVDDNHDAVEALELPADWRETDLSDDQVEIEGVDLE